MLVAALMTELGCEVVGPTSDIEEAVQIATDGDGDFAVRDINADGEVSDLVADKLRRRSIPFIFTTGYDVHHVDKTYDCLVISKPSALSYLQPIAADELGLPLPRAQ